MLKSGRGQGSKQHLSTEELSGDSAVAVAASKQQRATTSRWLSLKRMGSVLTADVKYIYILSIYIHIYIHVPDDPSIYI